MRCAKCGYEGARPEFKNVGAGAPCCAFMIARQCPRCGEINWSNTIEERDQDEGRLRQLCQEIKELVDSGNLERAVGLRREALESNDSLELDEERAFLAQVGRELRERGYSLTVKVEVPEMVGSGAATP